MDDRAARFERLYADNIDPWGFRSGEYERAKYDATLAALPKNYYAAAIEAGCSIGELTRLLASRCASMIGIDISSIALEEAARRNAELPHVSFLCGDLPEAWPEIEADLIVLSEVLYFLTAQEISQLASRISNAWKTPGDCVLVNFLGPIPEPLQGQDAAECFIKAMTNVSCVKTLFGEGYRIDILMRR